MAKFVMEELVKKPTLSVEEMAFYLGVGRNTAYDLTRQKRVPVVRVGRRTVIPRELLDEHVSRAAASGGELPVFCKFDNVIHLR